MKKGIIIVVIAVLVLALIFFLDSQINKPDEAERDPDPAAALSVAPTLLNSFPMLANHS